MSSLSIILIAGLLIVCVVAIAAFTVNRIVYTHSHEKTMALFAEKNRRIDAEEKLNKLRDTFSLCVMELARPTAAVIKKANTIKQGPAAVEDFKNWTLYLTEKVALISQLYAENTSGASELACVVNLRTTLIQIADALRDSVTVHLTIPNSGPVRVLSMPRDLHQSLMLLLTHSASLRPQEVSLRMESVRGSAQISIWTNDPLASKSRRIGANSLEAHLSLSVLRRLGATIVEGGHGEPLYTILLPLAVESTLEESNLAHPSFSFEHGVVQ